MDDENIFECINLINETDIELKKKNNKEYNTNIEIRKLLKDESIFFKITKQRAFQLLEALDIRREKLNEVYEKRISKKIFYDLLYAKKIDINDKNLQIQYPIYEVF